MLGHVNERLKENAEVLSRTQQGLGERLDNAARIVGTVQRSLGGLGEFFPEDLLRQILPPQHFSTQYSFRSGEKVDAVITLGSSLVPVDAKFPLENFKRILKATSDDDKSPAKQQFAGDVRKLIDAIAGKYILPDEGTYDFALMYIPAENVYYETTIRDDSPEEKSLCHYAMTQHVIPVSPNSFYAYLQAIVLGLKGLKIEDRAQEIIQYLSRLQGEFNKFAMNSLYSENTWPMPSRAIKTPTGGWINSPKSYLQRIRSSRNYLRPHPPTGQIEYSGRNQGIGACV